MPQLSTSSSRLAGWFGRRATRTQFARSFFFTAESPVSRYVQVARCDIERFRRFYHLMLDEGVYLAPSAFEAGFMSGAHTDADIADSVAAAARCFAKL